MKQDLLFPKDKVILDLTGGTGAWSEPYVKAGYDVRLITLPQDVRLYESPPNVWGVLAAPPCTAFAKVGSRWWPAKDADGRTLEALSIVDACIRIVSISKPEGFWSLENPVGRLSTYLGPPEMTFHPYEYGDPYAKRTCLWGEFNLPEKKPVEPIFSESNENAIDRYIQDVRGLQLTKENRAELRAVTPPGFAQAFFEANR